MATSCFKSSSRSVSHQTEHASTLPNLSVPFSSCTVGASFTGRERGRQEGGSGERKARSRVEGRDKCAYVTKK